MTTKKDKKLEKALADIRTEFEKGVSLEKCLSCSCMRDTLSSVHDSLSGVKCKGAIELRGDIKTWLKTLRPPETTCRGCSHCFPAVVTNIFNDNFEGAAVRESTCGFEVHDESWPVVPGEYFVCHRGAPVAVSTLSDASLAEGLHKMKIKELCIVGKMETENIGIDKVIKNVTTNSAIRFLILAGKDSKGHRSGQTILSLKANGTDKDKRVIGSKGKRPILKNVTNSEVKAFLKQVEIIDMVGCDDTNKIAQKIKELAARRSCTAACCGTAAKVEPVKTITPKKIAASMPKGKVTLDKAGYFVITPDRKKGMMTVEHYSYENELLRIITGSDTKSLYMTIVNGGWVTELSHAAYLGKELTRAGMCLKHNIKYIQDGA